MLSPSINPRCVFEPLFYLLIRLLSSVFTLHTVAQSLRPVFEMVFPSSSAYA